MTSYLFQIDPRRRKVGRAIARARRNLQKAFEEEKDAAHFTQAELARKLEVNRSVVNRQLMGEENLTLKSLAEWAWALERELQVLFVKPEDDSGRHNESSFEPLEMVTNSSTKVASTMTLGTTRELDAQAGFRIIKTSGS